MIRRLFALLFRRRHSPWANHPPLNVSLLAVHMADASPARTIR
jgi:hypothetical protein